MGASIAPFATSSETQAERCEHRRSIRGWTDTCTQKAGVGRANLESSPEEVAYEDWC